MEAIKYKYNKVLKKYQKCCKYLENHPEKYLPKLINFLETLDKILKEISIYSADEILNGFKE